jgi:hypothetical protein
MRSARSRLAVEQLVEGFPWRDGEESLCGKAPHDSVPGRSLGHQLPEDPTAAARVAGGQQGGGAQEPQVPVAGQLTEPLLGLDQGGARRTAKRSTAPWEDSASSTSDM